MAPRLIKCIVSQDDFFKVVSANSEQVWKHCLQDDFLELNCHASYGKYTISYSSWPPIKIDLLSSTRLTVVTDKKTDSDNINALS